MIQVTLTEKEFFLISHLIESAARQSTGAGPANEIHINYRANTPDMIDFTALHRKLQDIMADKANPRVRVLKIPKPKLAVLSAGDLRNEFQAAGLSLFHPVERIETPDGCVVFTQ